MSHSPIGESKSEPDADRGRADERGEAPPCQPFWALHLTQSLLPVSWIVGLVNRTGDAQFAQRLERFSERLRR